MKKFTSVLVLGVAIFIFGCASNFVFDAVAASTGEFCVNTSCGKAFKTPSWWPGNAVFAYEIMNKKSKGKGYKVKTLVRQNGMIYHLECARNLNSIEDCITWMVDGGYYLSRQGNTDGGGQHNTVEKGPIYQLPKHLYK